MDPSLLKERDAFKKRAMAMPAVEKRKAKPPDSGPSKKPRPSRPPVEKKPFDYKSTPGSSANKFGILAKIVNYMKTRHQQGDTHPLNLDEILDETNQLDVGLKIKHWLSTEALKENPKIEVKDGDLFVFKPKYNITSKKKLLKLLDKNDREGLGGILLEDVEEALPNCTKALKSLGDDILYITKPDKKQILFYNDKSAAFTVDEEFQKLWRSVAVEGIDERKIEEHLQKHGISSMQDIGLKKVVPIRKKKGSRKGGISNLKKTHNEHMGDVLKDYSSVTK